MRLWLLAALVVALTACGSRIPSAGGPSRAPAPTPANPSANPSAIPSATSPQPSGPDDTREACGRATRLSALTLNIHAGRTNDGVLALDRVADELEAWDADVVLLQEVDSGRERSDAVAQASWLGERLGLGWAYGPTRRLPAGTTGNAILSGFPLVDARFRSLPQSSGRLPRGLVQVTIDVDGREVDVMSTHLDHVSPAARRAQAAAVASVVRRIDRPVLLGGDLNAEPGLPPLDVLARAGLADPWPVVGDDDGLTVPAADPQRRIDYVLADDSFVPLRSEVLISSISDHRAVRTSFELPPPNC